MKETNKLFTGIILIITSLFLSYQNLGYLFPVLFIIALIQSPKTFKFLFSSKFLIFSFFFIAVVPLVLGDKDTQFYGVGYSKFFFEKSVVTLARGILILISLGMISSLINKDALINKIAKNPGIIAQVLSFALKILSTVTQNVSKSYSRFIQKFGKYSPYYKPVMFISFVFINLEILSLKIIKEQTRNEKKEKTLNE